MKSRLILFSFYLISLSIGPLPQSMAQVLAFTNQNIQPYRKEPESQPARLVDVLLQIKQYYNADILFEESLMQDIKVDRYVFDKSLSIEKNMELLLKSTHLMLRKVRKNAFVILPPKLDIATVQASQADTEPAARQNFPENRISTAAADITIKGTVTDNTGSVLPGVNVLIKGTANGTNTDAKGEYELVVPSADAVLVFSSIGFQRQEVTVGQRSVVNIKMAVETETLNEVVVTALGIKKEKKSLGYAISEVKGEELTQARSTNIANSLVGKVAGLNISGTATGPSGSTRIVIRGNGSISGNNQPLIIVDGIPINNDNLGAVSIGANREGAWTGADRGDGISSLNPDEIESISVLKGATAAALYGSRASNGAILVTTKGGKADRGIGVEVNSNFLAEDLLFPSYKDYQYEYGLGSNGVKPTTVAQTATRNSWGGRLDGSDAMSYDGQLRPYVKADNNLRKFYNVGTTFTNSIALTGATEKVTYRLSMNDLNNKGVLPHNTLRRNNFALNTNGNLGKNLSFVANAKYIIERNHNRPRVNDSPGNANFAMYVLPTSLDVDVLKESQFDANGNEKVWSDNQYTQNPYFATEQFQQDDIKKRIITSFEPKYTITDWLYLKGRIGFDNFNYRYKGIEPYGTGYVLRGSYTSSIRDFTETNKEILVGINRKLGEKFTFNGLFGGNQMKQVTRLNEVTANNSFNIPFFYDVSNIDPAARTVTEAYIEKRINSVYGSAEFSYDTYLFVTATARNDWFSTLAKGKNSIFYPSVGVSFVASEAVKMPQVINYLKFRGSWAQAGGDTDPYNLSLYYALNGAHLGSALAQINGTRVPNANLQPLTSTVSELGIEAKFFQNRLNLDVAVYDRKTTNDIVSATISETAGYTSALFNVGAIRNRGIELLIGGTILKAKDFEWDASFNMGYNRSEVLSLYGNLQTLRVDQSRPGSAFIHQDVGLPYSQIKGYDFKRDAEGNIVYNSQGLAMAGDIRNFGSGVPPYTLGLNNSFSYKGITLSVLVDGKFGGYIYSGTNALAYRFGLSKETLAGREGGVTGEGVTESGETNTAKAPAQVYYSNWYSAIATPFVHKSDFIKLRQIILQYSIPGKYLNKLPFKGASFSLVGRNLLVLMKKVPIIDPEATYNNGNAQGVEFAGTPPTRSYGVNLNLKF
ncbi:SusC/RagA family TonB-linked outer membrane protein [Dyadobacter bucti]|uniref:SusC/RagA family TonB-linked outer membrane protein n=1 Tax=Dyadobacter bucti TaxID=2572203 RepID=UPI001E4B570B|nr:SusC/RagA family TonB-linked outer membrane protein [Dyadobacter bucti]